MIPQIEPWIDEAELAELRRVIESTFVTEHALTAEFEQMTRELTGAPYAVSICNGTMGIFTVLKALGIGPGDEVIVPNLTFIATSNAVLLAGARPVLCEIRPDTFCIDIDRAETLVTPRTKAILPVHLYGQCADMDAVLPFARRHGIHVIEDAAQAVGVRFKGKHAGTFGDAGVLSYYGNKTITCGEGGIIVTEAEHIARQCYRLKNHGRDKKGVFIHEEIGFNFSFTEMQAAIGIAQMKKLPRILARKRQIYDRYREALASIRDLQAVVVDPRCSPVHWFTSFLTDSCEPLAAFLASRGIQTRRFFLPLHLQPCYQGVLETSGDFSVSESVFKRGLSLPSSATLTGEQQETVIKAILEFFG